MKNSPVDKNTVQFSQHIGYGHLMPSFLVLILCLCIADPPASLPPDGAGRPVVFNLTICIMWLFVAAIFILSGYLINLCRLPVSLFQGSLPASRIQRSSPKRVHAVKPFLIASVLFFVRCSILSSWTVIGSILLGLSILGSEQTEWSTPAKIVAGVIVYGVCLAHYLVARKKLMRQVKANNVAPAGTPKRSEDSYGVGRLHNAGVERCDIET